MFWDFGLGDGVTCLREETGAETDENTVAVEFAGGGVEVDGVEEGGANETETCSCDVEGGIVADFGECDTPCNDPEYKCEYNREKSYCRVQRIVSLNC